MWRFPRLNGLPICVSILSLGSAVSADVSLPAKGFSDNMVLQRGMSAPIWGSAAAGEDVTVSFRGKDVAAKAGTDGKWTVKVETGTAGGPFDLLVTGKNTLPLKNVMVGEVWLAGGQSNMEWTLKNFGGPNLDSAKVANYPDIRLMTFRGDGKWHPCDSASVQDFSASGYYFAKMLHQTLKVPIGIISSNVGGTEVKRWMDPVTLKAEVPYDMDKTNGDLYNQFIAPLVPYGIKGAIWYQGESDAFITRDPHPTWIASKYRTHFGDMIKGWRKVWNQGDFPFYYVQLANYMTAQTNPAEESAWAEVREAQRLSLSQPNTGMAVAIDIGDAVDIHPKNKWDVGKRLALNARALAYGETNLVWSGPIYKSMLIQGRTVRCVFTHSVGLKPREGTKLIGFAIAGADEKWVWADAVISKDTVIVSSAAVAAPLKVRYGWANNPACNLYNGAGLPASPFQTDGQQLPVALHPGKALASRAGNLRISPVEMDLMDALGRALKSDKRPKETAIRVFPIGR